MSDASSDTASPANESRTAPGVRGKAQAGGGDEASSGHLDKVRDILFGTHMREFERRFTRLEERLVKVSADLKDDVRKRVDALDSYVKTELQTLVARLKEEQTERGEAGRALARELAEAAAGLDRRIAQLSDHGASNERSLRQQMLEQSRQLSDEIEKGRQQLAAALESAFNELRSDKVDRAALASFLTEVAMRLTDEFRLPVGDPSASG
jgi:hypothetical protein